MTDLMDSIKGRRSIRNYKAKKIPGELLDRVLESVRWSPSWANTQCWEIIVVKDSATKKRFEEMLIHNPAAKATVQAPVVLFICGKLGVSGCYAGKPANKHGDWFMFDLGIATQNLCLTAHSLGLGTVIVGQFDHDRAKEMLDLPDGYEVVVMIPIGYPGQIPRAPKRREPAEFIHEEKF